MKTGTEIAMGLAPTIGEVIEEKERMAARVMRERCAMVADRHCAECLAQGLTNIGLAHKATANAIRALPLEDTGTEPRPSSVKPNVDNR